MTKTPSRRSAPREAPSVVTDVEADETATPSPEDGRTAPVQGFMASLWHGLDAAFTEASERVEKLKAELWNAERDLAAVVAIKRLRDGGDVSGGGISGGGGRTPRRAPTEASSGRSGGPRGAIPTAVLELITGAGSSGLTRSEILGKLQIGDDDKKGQQSVSNALSAGKRSGKFLHNGMHYSINA